MNSMVLGNIYASGVLEQVVVNFQRIRQRASHCSSLSTCTVAANCVSDDDMRGAVIGWWPAACGIIKAGDEVCYLRLPCHSVMRLSAYPGLDGP